MRFNFAFFILLAVPLSIAEEQPEQNEAPPEGSAPDSQEEKFEEYFKAIPKLQEYSGEWKEQDGILECDGFHTRNETEEFCSTEIPEDWDEFMFNGEPYYVQPLT